MSLYFGAASAKNQATSAQTTLTKAIDQLQAALAKGDQNEISVAAGNVKLATDAARVTAAAAGSPSTSSAVVSPLAQQFQMPNGSIMTMKTAEASYHPPDPQSIEQPVTIAPGGYGDAEPGFLEKAGMWLWVVPAGVVAVALGAYFLKHKGGSMSGYRRRKRSRRSR